MAGQEEDNGYKHSDVRKMESKQKQLVHNSLKWVFPHRVSDWTKAFAALDFISWAFG